jgi:hypothetical protein
LVGDVYHFFSFVFSFVLIVFHRRVALLFISIISVIEIDHYFDYCDAVCTTARSPLQSFY